MPLDLTDTAVFCDEDLTSRFQHALTHEENASFSYCTNIMKKQFPAEAAFVESFLHISNRGTEIDDDHAATFFVEIESFEGDIYQLLHVLHPDDKPAVAALLAFQSWVDAQLVESEHIRADMGELWLAVTRWRLYHVLFYRPAEHESPPLTDEGILTSNLTTYYKETRNKLLHTSIPQIDEGVLPMLKARVNLFDDPRVSYLPEPPMPELRKTCQAYVQLSFNKLDEQPQYAILDTGAHLSFCTKGWLVKTGCPFRTIPRPASAVQITTMAGAVTCSEQVNI